MIFCKFSPVGYNAGEISCLVVVHSSVTLSDEALLLSKCSDHTGAQQCLVEVRVDRRAAHRLQSFQLPRRGHIKTLTEMKKQMLEQNPANDYTYIEVLDLKYFLSKCILA